MAKFQYSFEIEETTIKSCSIVVEAPTLSEAMSAVEDNGPWAWEISYGKELYYEAEEPCNISPTDPVHWKQLDA